MDMTKSRLGYIDFLKCIGLFCVCLAHMKDLPNSIRLIRSFDVPFLMFVSASLSFITYKEENYLSYVWKRFRRLIFPTWIYLFIIGIILFILGKLEYKQLLFSFLFQKGAGYGNTWIILVYLTISMVVPFIRKVNYNLISFVTVISIIIIYELICIYSNLYNCLLLQYSFFYIIPYGIVCYFGIFAVKSSKKQLILSGVICIVLFTCLLFFLRLKNNKFTSWLAYNQPARIYYLLYGLSISFMSFVFFKDRDFKLFNSKIIVFISKHSLWIYLWHSFVILCIFKYVNFWLLEWIIVMAVSILIVFIQVYICCKIIQRFPKTKFFLNLFLC